MHRSFYLVLILCLVVPKPTYSSTSNNVFRSAFNSVLTALGLDDSSSSTEEDERQEYTGENLFLSRLLRDPNLRASADNCQEEKRPTCDPDSPYRTYDGTCNNLQHPTWGSAKDCLVRILPASYEGKFGIRKAVDGGPLPVPRDLTLKVFTLKKDLSRDVTLLFTTFGQLVAHDQALSTPAVGDDIVVDGGLDCCSAAQSGNPLCLPIEIKPDDPFFSKFNITCLNFMRGVKCAACKDNGKEHIMNIVTSAIDFNIAYGRNKDEALSLRTKDGTGKLVTRNTGNGEILPEDPSKNIVFCNAVQNIPCFKAGDPRVNQHTYLASLQTILVREHNRMVTQLKIINPHWNDEQLYQTGRRLVDAKLQAIVFNEYAPILLGKKYMAKYNLTVKKGGKSTQYNPTLRFGSWVEYTTGTFRVHSMVPSSVGYGAKEFKDMFSNNHPILDGQMSKVLQGSCRVPSQNFNQHQVPDLTNLLYKQSNQHHGLDLVAIDILRGRDHGLPPYLQVLNYCYAESRNITRFHQLTDVMTVENIRLLRNNYKSAMDIDLYVGMHLESAMEDGILPPTAACVVGGQLYFAKYGDRFYFEHGNQVPSFTAAQRKALKKSTIGRLICDNTGMKALTKNPFLFRSAKNPVLPCSQHPEVDLNLWKSSQ